MTIFQQILKAILSLFGNSNIDSNTENSNQSDSVEKKEMPDSTGDVIKDALRSGADELIESVKDAFKDTGGDLAQAGQEYAVLIKDLTADALAGKITFEEAKEGAQNVWMATKSNLISAGYESKANVVDALNKGLEVALKVAVTVATAAI